MVRTATLARFEVSGEIISEDTIAALADENCSIPGCRIDEDDLRAGFDLLLERWEAIRTEIKNYDTERLRRRWQLEVLEILGFENLEYLSSHTKYAHKSSIPLTHRSGDIHFWLLNSYGQSFDEKPEHGTRRKSPHEQFQAFLDQTDYEWGILFNGRSIRLLSDYHKTLTKNYVEADLESIFDSLDIDAFRVVWRIFHASRFAVESDGRRPIEKLREHSRAEGVAIGRELRQQVMKAIEALGNGFLSADREGRLLEALQSSHTAARDFYQALLRIVYRMLFLLFIESRQDWIHPADPSLEPVWQDSYSITRLRELAEESDYSRAQGEDLWEQIKITSRIVREGSKEFGISPYGGELFDDKRLWLLADMPLANSDLLSAVRLLTMFERDRQIYRVNFRTLDIEALGSVYESLLEVEPVITPDNRFQLGAGTERKSTGSYYTPGALVANLVSSALDPVIEDRLQGKTYRAEKEEALLSIKVVDPACGSGAFLVQAMDRLAEKLVEIRLEGEEPSDLDIREARRDVVRHCIHGVDLNPLAVDLCRFVLWINVAHPHFPLSYLEPLIKCGNSLVGVPLPSQWSSASCAWPEAIPDEAFEPVFGDDKAAARSAKRRNAAERPGQETLEAGLAGVPGRLVDYYSNFRASGDRTIDDIMRAQHLYETYLTSDEYRSQKLAADLWCAAFFWKYEPNQSFVPTHQWFRRARLAPNTLPEELVERVNELAHRNRFFHWHLEFPDVFESGGFDCVLGNPPWERIKLQEEEFFASRDPEIANAPNKAARDRMIRELPQRNPDLYAEYEDARHRADCESKFLRTSGRFPLTGRGDINTYAVFAEHFRTLISSDGMAGIVCPTGIATDHTTSEFFNDLMRTGSVVSLYDFENREGVFAGLHRMYKFCLLTMSGSPVTGSEFAFFLHRLEELEDDSRRIRLTAEDIALLNPNTRTLPVLRTRQDAELLLDIYRRLPVLVDERAEFNPWEVRFMAMFHMANDSHLFRDRNTLERDGYQLAGNRFLRGSSIWMPLYEGKMTWYFDHRFGTYEGVGDRSNTSLPTPTLQQHSDPHYTIMPWYWLSEQEVESRLTGWNRGWLLGFRRTTNATNERTFICTLIPVTAVGDSEFLMFLGFGTTLVSCCVGCLSAVCFDWCVRQKFGGGNMNFHYVRQFPVLPPQAFGEDELAFIVPRVLELTYTAWDIKPFADDLWAESGDSLKQAIENQWRRSAEETGGHEWAPHEWAEIRSNGIPLPPFRWHEDRRARLRAELDAYFARLYGLTRKQLRYILDPHGLSLEELKDILDPWEDPTCSGEHLLPSEPALDFPGETFRVLKNKEEEQYGEYRTRRLVLDAWARLEAELGPARRTNYRELLESVSTGEIRTRPDTAPPAPPKKPEPVTLSSKELTLRPPDSGQRKLLPDQPSPARLPEHSTARAHQSTHKRVLINSRPARLVGEEIREGKRVVTVIFDGESKPRMFYIPPASYEEL